MISDQGNWAKHQKGAFFDLVNVYRKLAENSLSDIAATYFQTLFRTKKRLKRRKKISIWNFSFLQFCQKIAVARFRVEVLSFYLAANFSYVPYIYNHHSQNFSLPQKCYNFWTQLPYIPMHFPDIFNNKKIYDNKKRFRRVRGDNMFHFSQIVDLALSMQRFPFRWAIIYLIGQA